MILQLLEIVSPISLVIQIKIALFVLLATLSLLTLPQVHKAISVYNVGLHVLVVIPTYPINVLVAHLAHLLLLIILARPALMAV
jgi:hypothetical protein